MSKHRTMKIPKPGGQAMEVPRKIDVTIYEDSERGTFVGAQISHELHGALMVEKSKRSDKVRIAELVIEALVKTYL